MKNQDQIKLKIQDITFEGKGVAKIDKAVIFVDGGLPGDEILAEITGKKKKLFFAKMKRLIHPSPYRVSAKCGIYEDCKNCIYMELNYEEEKKLKKNEIINALKRIGGIEVSDFPIYAWENPWNYRNKVEFKVQDGKLGYYKRGSHNFVSISRCELLDLRINESLADLENLLQNNSSIQAVTILSTQEDMIWILKQDKLRKIDGKFPDYVQVLSSGKDGVYIWHTPKRKFYRNVGNKTYELSPDSFFQVNQYMTKNLFDLAKEFANLQPNQTLVELYSGVGSISIYLGNKNSKITGVEIIPAAVEMAKKNAKVNGLNHANYLVGKSELIFDGIGKDMDFLLVDPPRAGLHQDLIQDILIHEPKKILYISCNPASLARDIKGLSGDYTLEKIAAVDMFPRTGNVETVVLLSKLNVDKHISVEI